MALTTLLTSATAASADLFTTDFQTVASTAYSVITGGGGSPWDYTSLINQQLQEAEAGQPSGTQMQLVVDGFRNPLTGTDYAGQVVNYVNQAWAQGQILGETGDPVETWQGNAYVAYVTQNPGEVLLQWTIGSGLSLVPLLFVIAAAGIVIYVLLSFVTSHFLQPWGLAKAAAAVTTGGAPGTPASLWASIPLWEKLVGAAVLAAGGIWFLSYKERVGIAAAGANRSSQEIIVER